jgi:hypothetical protein
MTMTIETIARTLATRGPFVESDVRRACEAQGVRLFSGGAIGETLRAMADAGEIVPSGTYVDPKTRKVLFRTGSSARPAGVSREESEFRAFSDMLGLDEETVTIETSAGAPVERRPPGVSAAEKAEYAAFLSMLGGAT